MCNNCIHKPVCLICEATGGVNKCKHHRENRKGKPIQTASSETVPFSTDSMCPFCSAAMLSSDRFCPMCGADMT